MFRPANPLNEGASEGGAGAESKGPVVMRRQGLDPDRLNHATSLLGCIILVAASFAATVYGGYKTYTAEMSAEGARIADDSLIDRDVLKGLVDRYLFLGRSLALNSRFTSGEDSKKTQALLAGRLSPLEARSLIALDHIDTWLPQEFGPAKPIPLNTRVGPVFNTWQLTRGLPQVSSKGLPLLSPRRSLSDSMLKEDPDIVSIAEVDSSGRVLFLVPYPLQTNLQAFNLSPLLHSIGKRGGGHAEVEPIPALRPQGGAATTTFVTGGSRVTGPFSLLLTVWASPSSLRRLRRDTRSATLYDAGGDVIFSTDPVAETFHPALARGSQSHTLGSFLRFIWRSDAPVYERTVPVPVLDLQFSQVTRERSANTPAAIRRLLTLAAAAHLLILVFVWWRLRFSFQTMAGRRVTFDAQTEALQVSLSNLFTAVTSHAKNLAHDYKNSLMTLRNRLDHVRGQVVFDDEVSLDMALHSLQKFGDILSIEFAPSAFEAAEIPGFSVDESAVARSTYLRGALHHIIEPYETRFDNSIRLVMPSDLDDAEPFVYIRFTTLTRIMDNLLENALAACHDVKEPQVIVTVVEEGSDICVYFEDNGCGIPAQHRSQIFSGFSTKGPQRGNGLRNCKERAAREDAILQLVSSEPGRTIMMLRVRRCPTPSWFVSTVVLDNRSVVVVVDDENSIGDYWEKALVQHYETVAVPELYRAKCVKLQGPSQLESDDALLESGTVFLIDYDFGRGAELNGIQLIERLNLADRAILVTAHEDEARVIEEVIRKGLRVLPKTFMYSVKFKITIGGI